jgi:hypothetical protein
VPRASGGRSGYPDAVSEEKTCVACGRTITWRKKWARNWDEVRYCSDACRRHRVDDTDRDLESAILELLDARGAGKTICPSEAARRVRPDDWRELMEPARRAARRLVAVGRIEITQHGQVVDPSTAKGPVRLRRR